MVSNYQNMLDKRLSKPKSIQRKTAMRTSGKQEKIYKNTPYEEQKLHMSLFSSASKERLRDLSPEEESFRRTFDDRTVLKLNSVFANNIRQYNASEKPQKHSLVSMSKF